MKDCVCFNWCRTLRAQKTAYHKAGAQKILVEWWESNSEEPDHSCKIGDRILSFIHAYIQAETFTKWLPHMRECQDIPFLSVEILLFLKSN